MSYLTKFTKRKRKGLPRDTHGMSSSPEYSVWKSLRGRCYSKTDKAYKNYGGRGIYICDRWIRSFEAFYTDMGPRPKVPKYTIERIDNDGSYTCGKCKECRRNKAKVNCRWATYEEQHRNRRNNRLITYNGITKCRKDWAREFGISEGCLKWRMNNTKLSFEQAVHSGPRRTMLKGKLKNVSKEQIETLFNRLGEWNQVASHLNVHASHLVAIRKRFGMPTLRKIRKHQGDDPVGRE